MDEIFDLKDKTRLFDSAGSMHDDVVTAIACSDGKLILEYGDITDYGGWKKVTVTYILDDTDPGVGLTVYKWSERGLRYVPLALEDLNSWHMLMYSFSLDSWGEMTLHMNLEKGRRALNATLSFRPVSVCYHWE